MKELPPIERLNELFAYDSITGIVTRNSTGKPILSVSSRGYKVVHINYIRYSLHRIVWKLHTGDDPSPYEIDHINRVKDDNRACNLRLVDRTGNLRNRGLFKNNRSGYKGVTKRGSKYEAQIVRNKKNHYLGSFNTAEDAHRAIIESDIYNS